MSTLTIKTENQEVLEAIKALLKTFEGEFEFEEESPYGPEFVKKIEESRQQIAEGKFRKISLDDIWKL